MSTLHARCLIVLSSIALAGTAASAQTTVPYPTEGGERQVPATAAGANLQGGTLSASPGNPSVSYGVGREKSSATGGEPGGNPSRN